MEILEKVTCFIQNKKGRLALFKHPYGGIQIPAGTVEPGESAEEAALREAREETGLKQLQVIKLLGVEDIQLPENEFAVLRQAIIYSRPDSSSFDWASIRRGIYVNMKGTDGDWCQINYREMNDSRNPEYVSYEITGWTKSELITNHLHRSFYLISAMDETSPSWTVNTDNHTFRLFWGTDEVMSRIQEEQSHWLEYLNHNSGKK